MAMSPNNFAGQLTLAAGVNKLKTLVIAAGFQGRFAVNQLLLTNRTGADIYYAWRDDVSAVNGAKHGGDGVADNLGTGGKKVDINMLHIFSAGGGVIDVVFHTS